MCKCGKYISKRQMYQTFFFEISIFAMTSNAPCRVHNDLISLFSNPKAHNAPQKNAF